MLNDVASHLAALDLQSSFVDWPLQRWHRSRGIFLQSRGSFEVARKHLRHCLMAKDEPGKKYRFRFYDPRVLRAFLPVCTPDEAGQFFGPVDRFHAATRDGAGVLVFACGEDGLRVTELSSPPPA